jgi:hypothetical protein
MWSIVGQSDRQTDRQTLAKQYIPSSSNWGIKKHLIFPEWYMLRNAQVLALHYNIKSNTKTSGFNDNFIYFLACASSHVCT